MMMKSNLESPNPLRKLHTRPATPDLEEAISIESLNNWAVNGKA
jgi:hypothetical protein